MKNKKGFTLIELLVVIAIIGIIASMVLIGLNSTRRLGRDARRISDIGQMRTALEIYFSACGVYPGVTGASTNPNCNAADPYGMVGAAWGVSQMPSDPVGNAPYPYCVVAGGNGYMLQATLEDPNNAVLSQTPPPIICGGFACGGASMGYCVSS